jgi:hypothetical protein
VTFSNENKWFTLSTGLVQQFSNTSKFVRTRRSRIYHLKLFYFLDELISKDYIFILDPGGWRNADNSYMHRGPK